jgi:Phycobilisome protein
VAALTAGARAAESLAARREELAQATTDALYIAVPGLLEKYGEPGRAKCLQDMRHTVDHLAPAVALEEPSLFERYVRWLEELLAARRVPTAEIRRALEVMEEQMRLRLPADEASIIGACLRAGVAVLPAES